MKPNELVNGNIVKINGVEYTVEVLPLTEDDIKNRRSMNVKLTEITPIQHIEITTTVLD